MSYKKTYVTNYLSIELCTNSRKIFTWVDNFLDFDAFRGKIPPGIKFFFHINELAAPNRRKNTDFLYKTRINKSGVLSIALAGIMAAIEIKPQKNLVVATIFDPQESCKEHILNVILMKPLEYLLARHGFFFLHASFLRKAADYILIAGDQGTGKSTLSLTLLQSGFDILSDDKCFMRKQHNKVSIFPFPTMMGLSENALKNHPHLAKQVLKNYFSGGKRRISLRSIFPYNSGPVDVKCRMILFPCYSAKKKIAIDKISAVKALDMLSKSNAHKYSRYASKKMVTGNFWTLYNLVKTTSVFKLTYNDNELNKIRELIGRNL